MHKLVTASSDHLLPVITELLRENTVVRIRVTGMSMYPFLRGGIDSVELIEAGSAQIGVGDVVLVKNNDGQYILHRVVRLRHGYLFIAGDAQVDIEGPVLRSQVVAVMNAAWRRERRIEASALCWRLFSSLWIALLPIRGLIINMYLRLRGRKR